MELAKMGKIRATILSLHRLLAYLPMTAHKATKVN